MAEVSTLLDWYVRDISRKFPTASMMERERFCLDLEIMAQFEGLKLEEALREHRDLLTQLRPYRQGLSDEC